MLEWHFLKLRERYLSLLDAQDARVVCRVGAFRGQKPMGAYIWNILQALHSFDVPRLEEAANKMIVDYNRLSMSQGSRTRHSRLLPRAKAKAAPAAS